MKPLHERILRIYPLLMGEIVGKDAAKKAADVLENNQELLAFLILKAGCFKNHSSIMQDITAVARAEVPRFTTSFDSRLPEIGVSDELEITLNALLTTYDAKTKVVQDAERLLRQHAMSQLNSTSPHKLQRWTLP